MYDLHVREADHRNSGWPRALYGGFLKARAALKQFPQCIGHSRALLAQLSPPVYFSRNKRIIWCNQSKENLLFLHVNEPPLPFCWIPELRSRSGCDITSTALFGIPSMVEGLESASVKLGFLLWRRQFIFQMQMDDSTNWTPVLLWD